MEFKDEKELIDNYLAGRASEEEARRLETWYNVHARKLSGQTGMDDYDYLQASADMWRAVAPPKKVKKLFSYRRVAVAAAVLAILGVGFYFFRYPDFLRFGDEGAAVGQYADRRGVGRQDIGPGGNKAVLTLSGGKEIVLNGAVNGSLAHEENTEIRKTADGQVVYSDHMPGRDVMPVYNMMTTPRGGQYSITLSDGTVATLDAGSSIRYPVAFRGKERRVEMSGQVYFKVVHDAARPFRVVVGGQIVEDLGTEFNINAYTDDPVVKTTLLEGAARVLKGKHSALLSPGQQAVTVTGSNRIMVRQANTEETMAWKNGYFRFNDEKIESIMTKLARWYNIEVVYEGKMNTDGFTGTASRNKNISQVLKLLENTKDIHFKIEGRRVTVIN